MDKSQRQGTHLDEVSRCDLTHDAKLILREPKDVADEEYKEFYKAVAKDQTAETLGWAHFKARCCLCVL